LTLIELLVVVSIISIVVTIALPHYITARMRARVVKAQTNIRALSQGLDVYFLDNGCYPRGKERGLYDPYGIFAGSCLPELLDPIPYISEEAFRDPFGPIRVNPRLTSAGSLPGSTGLEVNPDCYLLYFHYPKLAEEIRRDPRMNREGYAVVSIGPDNHDSLIVYYPFPFLLGNRARTIGIRSRNDTIYDPSNGTFSPGDLGAIGGFVSAPRFLGGQ
jgi:type II secretory pathway pseudopilin PulG